MQMVNLGANKDPKPILISEKMSLQEKELYIEFSNQNRDVFTLIYSEMPGLDPAVAMHYLTRKRQLKQVPSRMHPDFKAKVEAEMDKLVKAAS